MAYLQYKSQRVVVVMLSFIVQTYDLFLFSFYYFITYSLYTAHKNYSLYYSTQLYM